jgi:CRISPR-associated endonuclease Csn1
MADQRSGEGLILGLDVGANSVGWALLRTNADGNPYAMKACGSRVFEAGVNATVDQIAAGKDPPRGVQRRLARMQRRQTLRRARRRKKVYCCLMRHGLMPKVPKASPQALHDAVAELDKELRGKWIAPGNHRGHLVFPYLLRAAAAERRLDPMELGRAMYHLAHRRGFRSNRKTRAREDEEGKVKQGIGQLRGEMAAAGARTLGAYLASLDPRTRRIRGRYTDRSMYVEEFTAIRRANPGVADKAWEELEKAIFFQRKLKSAKHLVGKCTCLPARRRASMWHPLFQRYRILEQVNNLRVAEDGSSRKRKLTEEERDTLIGALSAQESMSAAGVRKVLKLKGAAVSIDAVGTGELIGDRTACAMREVFGERWDSMSEQDRMQALLDVHSYEKICKLKKRGIKHWKLDPDRAAALADMSLEPGYASLSTKALAQLLKEMESGLNSREAMDRVFPGRFTAAAPSETLPPVTKALGEIRNAVVMRSLTELRRVVNGIVRRWGKPSMVRLELARDIKRGRRERERMAKENRAQEKARKDAEKAICDAGIAQPSRTDIEKLLLAEECGFTCPYTGRKFGMADLFGPTPTVDVEHIIPYSRSLDDSFANKTLSVNDENRIVKGRRTPHEAYSSDAGRWEQILARVRLFKGRHARAKLGRFEMPHVGAEIIEEFSSRQLNDTRYASRLAAGYVGQLYGGTVDASGVQRVQTSSGGLTARLRQALGLEKNRKDHRHHALDAITVALASPAVVKAMSDAASLEADAGRNERLQFPMPWDGFQDQVRHALDSVVVSHRVDRRLAGALHEETGYSRPLKSAGGVEHRVRKPVSTVVGKALDGIADPRIRAVVAGAGGAPASPIARRDGDVEERVRRVRLPAARTAVELQTANARRWVSLHANHHMAVYSVTSGSKVSWKGEIVTRLEAHRRKRAKEPIIRRVIKREGKDDVRLVFSLRRGDCIAIKDEEDKDQLFVVTGFHSEKGAEVRRHNDARASRELRAAGPGEGRMFVSARQLMKGGAQKLNIDALGQEQRAND